MLITESLQITIELSRILEQVGIEYLVGGSLASSLHGLPRATQDVDLLIEMSPGHVEQLITELQGSYYFDEYSMRDAISRKGTFNLIHLGSMFKIDLFVSDGDDLLIEEMARARVIDVSDDPSKTLRVADAADIVLQKLIWFEKGGGTSERQWGDVLGVLKVKGEELDNDYLDRWADVKGLRRLLDRARAEAGGKPHP